MVNEVCRQQFFAELYEMGRIRTVIPADYERQVCRCPEHALDGTLVVVGGVAQRIARFGKMPGYSVGAKSVSRDHNALQIVSNTLGFTGEHRRLINNAYALKIVLNLKSC